MREVLLEFQFVLLKRNAIIIQNFWRCLYAKDIYKNLKQAHCKRQAAENSAALVIGRKWEEFCIHKVLSSILFRIETTTSVVDKITLSLPRPNLKKLRIAKQSEQIKIKRNREILEAQKALLYRNGSMLTFKVPIFKNRVDDISDWQEIEDEQLLEKIYFSPSRGELTLKTYETYEFERKMIGASIRFRNKFEGEFQSATICNFNSQSGMHQVKFLRSSLGQLWLNLQEHSETIYISLEPGKRSIDNWQLLSDLLSQHRHEKEINRRFALQKLELVNSET